MPLGRECSPLLLHRTTPSEHVQTSGQPDVGRQPLSSAPERGGNERVSGVFTERQRERMRGERRIQRGSWGGEKSNSKMEGETRQIRAKGRREKKSQGRTKQERERGIHRDNNWTVSEAHGQFHSTQLHSALLKSSLQSTANDQGLLNSATQVCFNIWLRTYRHVTAILKTLRWLRRNTEQMWYDGLQKERCQLRYFKFRAMQLHSTHTWDEKHVNDCNHLMLKDKKYHRLELLFLVSFISHTALI